MWSASAAVSNLARGSSITLTDDHGDTTALLVSWTLPDGMFAAMRRNGASCTILVDERVFGTPVQAEVAAWLAEYGACQGARAYVATPA